MFIILLILFIIECFGFCFLFYKYLENSKDIETLYKNYSEQLENITKNNMTRKENFFKWCGLLLGV